MVLFPIVVKNHNPKLNLELRNVRKFTEQYNPTPPHPRNKEENGKDKLMMRNLQMERIRVPFY